MTTTHRMLLSVDVADPTACRCGHLFGHDEPMPEAWDAHIDATTTDHQSLYNAGIIRAELSLYALPLPDGRWGAECSTHGALINRRFTITYDDEPAARSALAHHLHEEHPDFTRTRRLTPALDVVFDGPPAATAGRFVEVEDQNEQSIAAGEWVDRGNGTWALRLPGALPPTPAWLLEYERTGA